MIRKKIKRELLASVVLLVFSLNVFSDSSVFEVSKGDSTLFLGGTIHLLRPADFPLPDEFERAFQQSQQLVFETDLEQVSSMSFSQKMMQEMMYKDGTTVDKVLSPVVWAQLQAYSEKHSFPLAQMKIYHPAFLSITMTVMECQRLGMVAGVEAHFNSKKGAKTVGALESGDDVLTYMRTLKNLDGDALIASSIRELDTIENVMEMAIAAWRKGDMETLYTEMTLPMQKETPEVYETLLVQRNRKWLPQIEALLTDGDIEFVMVGAMHLAGPNGLLNLLKNKGYSVKPYAIK